MIITLSGKAGSGKSTVAKMLAEKLSLKHYSTGDLMRRIAKDNNLTLAQVSKLAEKEKWIDKELDLRQENLGKTEDNFIIDGRLSWHFIPKSVKVYLDVNDTKAAERIWADRDKRKVEDIKSFKDLVLKLKKRKESETKRYENYYKINYHDKKNYDLVIDTSRISAKEVVEKIRKHVI